MNRKHSLYPLIITLALFILNIECQNTNYNQSICTSIGVNDLHYFINDRQNNQNIIINSNNTHQITYNLCKQVEVYCKYLNTILTSSMVIIDNAL